LSGRKTFTAGEVLQAADVNDFLMDQSVMVFAGTAARGSAIPSPTEGMVTYREDDDVVEVYDGSSFKPVGGLIDVKSALFTGTQSASVTAGSNVAVTDLSITHEVADASNKLIITACFGVASGSAGSGRLGIAVAQDGTLITVGDAAGSRTRVGAGGQVAGTGSTSVVSMPSITFVHSPGAGSKTYTVRAINVRTSTQTLYINRSEADADDAATSRGVSSLVIQEVAV